MKHLNDGTLRRLLDEPLAIVDSQKKHLTSCADCRTRYARIEADADAAAAMLDLPAFTPNVSTALARVTQRVQMETPDRAPGRLGTLLRRRSGIQQALGGLAAVGALLAAVTVTPAGSLAQSFVTIFQPTAVTAVQLSTLDIQSLAQLRHFGTIHLPERIQGQQVTSVGAASSLSGMKVLAPASVPAGVPTQPAVSVSPGATASFTFNAAKATTWAVARGKNLPAMPAGVDGSTIDVTVGATVVSTYGGCLNGCSGIPQLVIGQMVAPHVTSTGAGLTELEDYVFSLPGVSPQLATELRSIGDPTSTLPIPIPSSFAHADPITVQGVHGEAIGDNTGIGSLVVWEKAGIVYAVGGTLPLDQVESIANALQ